jgi:hypothetical protein
MAILDIPSKEFAEGMADALNAVARRPSMKKEALV